MAVRGSRINVVYAVSYADRGTRQLLADDRRVRSSVRQTSAQMSQSARAQASASGRAATATGRQARAHTQLAARARGAAVAENAEARAARSSAAAHSRATVTASRHARSYDQIARSASRAEKTQRAATVRARAQVGAAGASARAGAGFAGAFGIAGAIRQTVQFDKAMRNVNSLAGLGEKRFQALSKEVRQLGGRTAQMPTVLAEGLYDIIGSGFKARDAMTVLNASARAASAGLTTTDVSAKVVSGTLNAYRMNASQAGHVADVLFRTVDRGVVSFEDLAQSIGPAMPMAVNLGVSLESLGGAIATMTKQGIDAPETMTALRGAMTAMSKPSDDMKAAFDRLGVDGAEQLVERTGSLQGALKALAGTTDGSTTSLSKMFREVRGRNAVLALTGKNARGATRDLKQMGDVGGATDRAYREQAKSTSRQWELLKATASDLGIAIASRVLPALNKGMQGLLDFGRAHPTIAKVAGAVLGVGLAIKALKFAKALLGVNDLVGGLRRLGQTKAGQAVASNVIGAVRGIPGRTRQALGGMRNLMSRLMGRAGTAGGSAVATSTAATAASKMPTRMKGKQGSWTAAGRSTGVAMGRSAGVAGATTTAATMAGGGAVGLGGALGSKSGRFRAVGRGVGRAIGGGLVIGVIAFIPEIFSAIKREAMKNASLSQYSGGQGFGELGGDMLDNLRDDPITGKIFRGGGRVGRYATGGQVVALSPGELGIEPGGRAWTVPGQPVAADNFFTRVPTGTEIFTGHGQSMLAAGASRSEALANQIPHFRKGGTIQDFNKRYPEHTVNSTKGKTQLTSRQVRAIGEHQGFSPGLAKQMDQLAAGESNRYPGIRQIDPGDGNVGYGLLQMTPNAWGALAKKWLSQLGGLANMLNPVKNMRMAKLLSDDARRSSGNPLAPWYGTKYLKAYDPKTKSVAGMFGAVAPGQKGGGGGGSRRVELSPSLTFGARLPSARSAWTTGYQAGVEGEPLNIAASLGAARARLKRRFKTVGNDVVGKAPRGRAPGGKDAKGKVAKALREARKIEKARYAYQWGGGHTTPAVPSMGVPGGPHRGPNPGYDCSGAIARVLQVGGFPWTTGHSSQTAPVGGEGKKISVYSGPGHTYMKILGSYWGTSGSNPMGGPGWLGKSYSFSGASPSHFRGYRRGGTIGRAAGRFRHGGTVSAARRSPGKVRRGGGELGAVLRIQDAVQSRFAEEIGAAVRVLMNTPIEGGNKKVMDALRQFGHSIELLDETTVTILGQRVRDLAAEAQNLARRGRRFRGVTRRQLRRRVEGLRDDGIARRERPRLRRIREELSRRGELRGVRGELRETRGRLNADVPGYRRLERMERSLGRKVGRLERGKETRDQRVAIRRLEAAQRVVQTEMGRRTGLMVRGVEKQAEALERGRARLGRVLRRRGIDEASSAGLKAVAAFTASQVETLKASEAKLRVALRRASRRGDRGAVADITERLKGVRDEIAETATSWIEQMRDLVRAGAQERVDFAAHGTSIASLRVARFELEQQLAGTYETGGAARAERIRETVLPALLAEQGALQAQLAAAQSIGDAVLARQIAEALEAKLNEQLQAQLDIKEASAQTAENTEDLLKEFTGSLAFEYGGQSHTDLVGIGAGA